MGTSKSNDPRGISSLGARFFRRLITFKGSLLSGSKKTLHKVSTHSINNGKAPTNMLKLFQKTSNIHSYNTRSSTSGKFFVKSSRLEIQNNSFSRLGVKLWNKISRYITDLPKRTFKRVLRKLLFDILEKEDDYIQIPMIIQKVGT